MNKIFHMNDISSEGFLHARIYNFALQSKSNRLVIDISGLDLIGGAVIHDAVIEIYDWSDFKFFLPGLNVHLNSTQINDFYIEHKSDFDIYDFTYDGNSISFNGYGDDLQFNVTVLKPKIKITGDYDPD